MCLGCYKNIFLTTGCCLTLLICGLLIFCIRCFVAGAAYVAANDGDMNVVNILESEEFNDWENWDYWFWGVVPVGAVYVSIFLVVTFFWCMSSSAKYGFRWLCCSYTFHPQGHCDGVLCLCCRPRPSGADLESQPPPPSIPMYIINPNATEDLSASSCTVGYPVQLVN
jgi:hypothetical protein